MNKNLHKELVEKADSFITDYRDDLLKHDLTFINRNPEKPFLHFTGSSGTHIIPFHFFEDYPPAGEFVPYLFGRADRNHILEQLTSALHSMPNCNRMDLIIYCDGENLYEINYQIAENKLAEYTRKMKRQFEIK